MTAHRYWRITMTSGAGNAYAFSEIQFRMTAGTPLAFSGGTASAAQTFSTFGAANAADGNIATLYSSTDKTAPQWWAYDLGAGNSRDVVEIMITNRVDSNANQAPSSFTPEWSDDGTTWHGNLPITTAAWTTLSQTQVFAVTPLVANAALLTQIVLEQWGNSNPAAQMTQVSLEQWASVTGVQTFSARHV